MERNILESLVITNKTSDETYLDLRTTDDFLVHGINIAKNRIALCIGFKTKESCFEKLLEIAKSNDIYSNDIDYEDARFINILNVYEVDKSHCASKEINYEIQIEIILEDDLDLIVEIDSYLR